MLFEHNKAREFVKNMEKSLEEKDKKRLVENARDYINLIQEHIFKEENILYPIADNTLDKETEKEILIKFKKITQKNKEQKHLDFVKRLKLRK